MEQTAVDTAANCVRKKDVIYLWAPVFLVVKSVTQELFAT